MNNLLRLMTVALVGSGLAVAAGPAQAEAPAVVDCSAHSKLTHHYTVAELNNALATMPADIKEYTDCYQLIQNQLYTQIGKLPGKHSKGSVTSSSSSGTVILIIAVIVIVLAGGGLALAASRRRGGDGPGGGGAQPPAAGS